MTTLFRIIWRRVNGDTAPDTFHVLDSVSAADEADAQAQAEKKFPDLAGDVGAVADGSLDTALANLNADAAARHERGKFKRIVLKQDALAAAAAEATADKQAHAKQQMEQAQVIAAGIDAARKELHPEQVVPALEEQVLSSFVSDPKL